MFPPRRTIRPRLSLTRFEGTGHAQHAPNEAHAETRSCRCMPTEISVGTPLLTINEGATFMVTDLDGQIAADSELGVFADDTRFVSYYSISADGNAWRRLTSAAITYYASRVYLVNNAFETEAGAIPSGTV